MFETFEQACAVAHGLATADAGRQQHWCVVALPYGGHEVYRADGVPALGRVRGAWFSRYPGHSSWTPGRPSLRAKGIGLDGSRA